MNNPRDIANEAIRCIREGDVEGYIALFYGVDRSEVGSGAYSDLASYVMILEKKLDLLGSVTQVGELREFSPDEGPAGVVAYLREEDNRIFVALMNKKGDDYTIDDIYKLSHEVYDSLNLLSENV